MCYYYWPGGRETLMAHYFQLADAKTCGDFDCGACWSMRESRVCPRCGFALSLPLSRYLNRPASKPPERGDARRRA